MTRQQHRAAAILLGVLAACSTLFADGVYPQALLFGAAVFYVTYWLSRADDELKRAGLSGEGHE